MTGTPGRRWLDTKSWKVREDEGMRGIGERRGPGGGGKREGVRR